MFTTETIKQHFPIFTHQPNLVYLDSAATTQKLDCVIAKTTEYYEHYNANIARGLYELSEKATAEYESVRTLTARFLNAISSDEVIFTKGTTESINLLAYSLGQHLKVGDEILLTTAEHHSNFLPWQALAERTGATLTFLPVNIEGHLALDTLDHFITTRTKIFAFSFVSNVLGTINPVAEIISKAKSINPAILTVIDAAQAVAHLPIDVQALGCDFIAFSAHKMFGPTGVGVLWGKLEYLNCLTPFQYGGEMVLEAKASYSLFKSSPHKFEAGTPNIAGVIAFGEAIRFLEKLDFASIRTREVSLLEYAHAQLSTRFGKDITILGTRDAHHRSGIIAFTLKSIHPHDIAQLLGEESICIRAGQHCATPLHETLNLPATARLSVSLYTTKCDIDTFLVALQKIKVTFQR
jgi:cysteine desulfurase/selenocysteine lyase